MSSCDGGKNGSGADDNKGKRPAAEEEKCSPTHNYSLSRSTSSSIGEYSTDDTDVQEDADQDDQAKKTANTLNSFASSLEAVLPMKRGLSDHYVGKSKSFVNLTGLEDDAGASPVEGLLGKEDHGVNKKRRLLIAHKLREKKGLGTGGSSDTSTTATTTTTAASSTMDLTADQADSDDHPGDEEEEEEEEKKLRSCKG